MKVRLVDVDSKIPNLALMKISNYHKSLGDDVDFYQPLLDQDVDLVYASKIFNFTNDYQYYPSHCEVRRGGSGYDVNKKLPDEIDNQLPDYSLYDIDYSLGFTTRGCIRNCDFCIVKQKEGGLRAVGDIYDFWDRDHKKIKLLDNNLTAHREQFELVVNQIIDENLEVDFNQGLDIRLISEKQASLLSKVKLWKQIHLAFDDISSEDEVRNGIKLLNNNGVKSYKMMFYVLIGFNSTPEEDLYRVEMLDDFGVDPFVMPYKDISNIGEKKLANRCGFSSVIEYRKYMKNFARWVNHKAIFRSVEWGKYSA